MWRRLPILCACLALAGCGGRSPAPSPRVDVLDLLAHGGSLHPSRLTIRVAAGGQTPQPVAQLTVSDSPKQFGIRGLANGTVAGQRLLDGEDYLALPGFDGLTGGRTWVTLPAASTSTDTAPSLDAGLLGGVRSILARLSYPPYRETRSVIVDGVRTTELSFTFVQNAVVGRLTMFVASDGQLVRLSVADLGGQTLVMDVFTSAPVSVAAPPAAATIALSALAPGDRAQVHRLLASAGSPTQILAGLIQGEL